MIQSDKSPHITYSELGCPVPLCITFKDLPTVALEHLTRFIYYRNHKLCFC